MLRRRRRRPPPPSLFDSPAEVEAARADGIARADEHANPDWKQAARRAIAACAYRYPDFTADEVWAELAEAGVDCSTHEPSALGPVFLAASRAGIIRKTGATRRTKLARRHRDLTVWRRA